MGSAGPSDAESDEPLGIFGPGCHFFEVGDDVILPLAASGREGIFEVSSQGFFVIVDDRFSPELDAARRSLGGGWGEGELLQQARDLTPDQFLDVLREADDSGT